MQVADLARTNWTVKNELKKLPGSSPGTPQKLTRNHPPPAVSFGVGRQKNVHVCTSAGFDPGIETCPGAETASVQEFLPPKTEV